jgi:hypothetical protein
MRRLDMSHQAAARFKRLVALRTIERLTRAAHQNQKVKSACFKVFGHAEVHTPSQRVVG